MPVTVQNPVILNKIKRIGKPPISAALKIIAGDLKAEAASHGWKRFGKGIEYVKDSDTTGRVFVNDEVTGSISRSGLSASGNIGTANNNQIGAYLHYGTPDHGPVTAKFLRFRIGSKIIYTKRVKGIPATPWWGLKETSKEKVRELLLKNSKS